MTARGPLHNISCPRMSAHWQNATSCYDTSLLLLGLYYFCSVHGFAWDLSLWSEQLVEYPRFTVHWRLYHSISQKWAQYQ